MPLRQEAGTSLATFPKCLIKRTNRHILRATYSWVSFSDPLHDSDARHRTPSVASTSHPSLIDLQDLQLDDARALLEHAGQDSGQASDGKASESSAPSRTATDNDVDIPAFLRRR